MSRPFLVSIQVGQPQTLGSNDASDPMDREWTTGFFKQPVSGPVALRRTNLDGDGQADLENHGGLDKAVNVYPAAHYPLWTEEPGLGSLPFGGFGENFTIAGLTESAVAIGDVFAIGDAVVQISQPRQPCWKLARRWRLKDLAARVIQTGRTGWYFRVLQEGTVATGMPVRLIDRPHPDWTVAAANDVMHHRRHDREAALALAACPALSASWRESLERRAKS